MRETNREWYFTWRGIRAFQFIVPHVCPIKICKTKVYCTRTGSETISRTPAPLSLVCGVRYRGNDANMEVLHTNAQHPNKFIIAGDKFQLKNERRTYEWAARMYWAGCSSPYTVTQVKSNLYMHAVAPRRFIWSENRFRFCTSSISAHFVRHCKNAFTSNGRTQSTTFCTLFL